jgi:hypothetical protein
MANNLSITEYAQLSNNPDSTPILSEPSNAQQNVTLSASSIQSASVKSNTQYVRLVTDTTCSVAFGTNPTAVTATRLLIAGVPEIVKIPLSSNWKIAAVL